MNDGQVVSLIHCQDLWKVYRLGDVEVQALRGLNLTIEQGEFVAIMGSSGSGKSTLLNLLGGLDRPTHGKYILGGEDVSTMSDTELSTVRNQKIGFIFQSFNLLPMLTARENAELPLRIAGTLDPARVDAVLEAVGLADRASHRPAELSGGQQQRVALARALAIRPDVLLLDEPLSNLDAKLRQEVRVEIRELQRQLGLTTVMVTHDQEEALTMADRLVVMSEGRVRQVGSQRDLYERPADRVLELLNPLQTHGADFLALQGIDLTIEAGESVAIIGRNGSGKSTLLQLVCGLSPPSAGDSRRPGRNWTARSLSIRSASTPGC